MAMPKRGDVRMSITFPQELYDQIKKMAEEQDRTFGLQVLRLCRVAIKKETDAEVYIRDLMAAEKEGDYEATKE